MYGGSDANETYLQLTEGGVQCERLLQAQKTGVIQEKCTAKCSYSLPKTRSVLVSGAQLNGKVP